MIGRKTGFIFVHVPKTGGQSVSAALWPYALAPHERAVQRLWRLTHPRTRGDFYGIFPGGGHARAADLRGLIGAERFDAAYSFAFVRNPWDRAASLYHFVKTRPGHRLHPVAVKGTLEDFALALGPRSLRPQMEFVADAGGEMLVDFVGRFERLGEDFAAVCARLGIAAHLPHRNATRRGDYRRDYTDRAAERVAALAAADITAFGYSF